MSSHDTPIPPPVVKPHPDARMMQTMTGEWVWAIECAPPAAAAPAPPVTCATCRHCRRDLERPNYVACWNPSVPVQIFTPVKAAEWGCVLWEPAPAAGAAGQETV